MLNFNQKNKCSVTELRLMLLLCTTTPLNPEVKLLPRTKFGLILVKNNEVGDILNCCSSANIILEYYRDLSLRNLLVNLDYRDFRNITSKYNNTLQLTLRDAKTIDEGQLYVHFQNVKTFFSHNWSTATTT